MVLLGSTGSIGTQAVDVLMGNPERFEVSGLAFGGSLPSLPCLVAQALALDVPAVAVAAADHAAAVRDALSAAGARARVSTGPQAVADLAGSGADVVLNALPGAAGLVPTLAALAAGSRLALANKESLVAGGDLVTAAAAPGQIVPVDSEHSALAQCLAGGTRGEVARLVLTASGGPFRGWRAADLADVTPEQALAHPTWSMGSLVTVNSATLVNKGLEVIEAHLLFGVAYDEIDVVVHPQSVVHSMVTFVDGSTLAQASPPDMRLPIAWALGYPDRLPAAARPCDFAVPMTWEFHPLDRAAFPAVDLAVAAGRAGGGAPAVFNAANEVAVAAFLAGRLSFPAIVETVAAVVADLPGEASRVTSVDDIVAIDEWARRRAAAVLQEVAV